VETAESVGTPRGLAPLRDPRLRELHIGRWTGLRRDEIAAGDADALARFLAGDPDARAGDGESRAELTRRVGDALASIAAAHAGRRVALVTHLGVVRVLLGGAELGHAEWRCLVPSG
jgi:probable phosphoglycerate mutase